MTSQDGGCLPTGEVARRLGVSPVTLRSWERRYGIGPAARDLGHHRRWSAADIDRLEAMCRLTSQGLPPAEAARIAVSQEPGRRTAPPPRDSAPHSPDRAVRPEDEGGVRRRVRGLIRAADRLDAPTLQELLTEALDLWGVEAAWDELIAPTLRAAGRRWATTGEPAVEVEHFLSWHVATELRRRACPVPRHGQVALLAAVPGEDHTLPLDGLAAALAGRGIAYRMLGLSVPPIALAQAFQRLGPAAVVLWSQTRATVAPHLAADLLVHPFGVAGARHRPLLLLAGPGWQHATVPDHAVRPASLRAAVDLIASTTARGNPSESAPAANNPWMVGKK